MHVFPSFSGNVGSRFSVTISRTKSLTCLTFTGIYDIIIKSPFEAVTVIMKDCVYVSVSDNSDILNFKLFNTI